MKNKLISTQSGELLSYFNSQDQPCFTYEEAFNALRYDYATHEQIEIDRLVYNAYKLNAEDIMEVENWYARRYPRLSTAQKGTLRKLGTSDDYLEYGYKSRPL